MDFSNNNIDNIKNNIDNSKNNIDNSNNNTIEKRISLKNRIADVLYKILNNFYVSNRTLGTWIRAFHYNGLFLVFFMVLFGPKILANIALALIIVTVLLFFLLEGCLLSRLEYKLTGDNDNICNIALELLRIEKTKEHQLNITKIVLIAYLPIILVIYYYRFIKNIDIFSIISKTTYTTPLVT